MAAPARSDGNVEPGGESDRGLDEARGVGPLHHQADRVAAGARAHLDEVDLAAVLDDDIAGDRSRRDTQGVADPGDAGLQPGLQLGRDAGRHDVVQGDHQGRLGHDLAGDRHELRPLAADEGVDRVVLSQHQLLAEDDLREREAFRGVEGGVELVQSLDAADPFAARAVVGLDDEGEAPFGDLCPQRLGGTARDLPLVGQSGGLEGLHEEGLVRRRLDGFDRDLLLRVEGLGQVKLGDPGRVARLAVEAVDPSALQGPLDRLVVPDRYVVGLVREPEGEGLGVAVDPDDVEAQVARGAVGWRLVGGGAQEGHDPLRQDEALPSTAGGGARPKRSSSASIARLESRT